MDTTSSQTTKYTKQKLSCMTDYLPRRAGKGEYLKFKRGEYCTQRELIRAKCYECMGFYTDGALDCQITGCPLHKFQPYREK